MPLSTTIINLITQKSTWRLSTTVIPFNHWDSDLLWVYKVIPKIQNLNSGLYSVVIFVRKVYNMCITITPIKSEYRPSSQRRSIFLYLHLIKN